MKNKLPNYMHSTYDMVKSTYPSEVPDGDYLSLLCLLYQGMSERNVADFVSKISPSIKMPESDYSVISNDLAKARANAANMVSDRERVKNQLSKHGYVNWLKED